MLSIKITNVLSNKFHHLERYVSFRAQFVANQLIANARLTQHVTASSYQTSEGKVYHKKYKELLIIFSYTSVGDKKANKNY